MLQAFRHIAIDNPLGQAFHNGGFANARFADQGRVILGPARQDLDDPPDFFITPDDRVHLSLARHGGQVASIFLQGLVGILRVLGGDPLIAAHRCQ